MPVNFKQGERVVLTSSTHQEMNLDVQNDAGEWKCKWIDKSGEPQERFYHPSMLDYPNDDYNSEDGIY